jgi:hypothetical protein
MPLSPLPPVLAANIADDHLLFAWDEWNVRAYYEFDDAPILKRLAAVSGRGSMALTLAVGEWVCQRFARVGADPEPWYFLEAGWTAQMKPGRCTYTEIVEDNWRGPSRGPLAMVITIANDVLFCLDEDATTSVRAMWMTNLARHVLPNRDAFDRWLAAVLDMLVQHHPKNGSKKESLPDDEFELGRPVARELFDTTKPYVRVDEPALIARFLQLVDPRNPFLAANQSEE